jgi:tetratricopeptide (TPR) repeat protein
MAAAIALACATCGRNNTTALGQPAPAVPVPVAAQPVSEAALADAHTQLAGKFVEAAEQILHNGIPGAHQWEQGAALLEAACNLDPKEPSYPRLLAETWRQLGDNDQVIAALTKYRAAALAARWPDDQVVQVELIDRYLSRMETVDQRIRYLREVLAMPSLAPEVKSHAAVLCVPLLAQRSDAEAEGMITQALRLDSLSMPALRLQYQSVARQGSTLERIHVLLDMVRSNPCQRDVLEELAKQLSEAGLADASLEWYRQVLVVCDRAGTVPDVDTVLDFAAQSYAAGQYADADVYVNQVIESTRRDPNAWFMRLAFDKLNPERQPAYAQELDIAKRVFVIQASEVAKKILPPVKIPGAAGAPETAPATEPATQPADLAGVNVELSGINNEQFKTIIARINRGQAPRGMAELFVSAISDIAWFHLYFEDAPDEAVQWVTILKSIVPANDIRVIRLQGWLDLTTAAGLASKGESAEAAHRYALAQAELSKIQDIDPLAMMGIIRMTGRGVFQGLANAAPAHPAPATRPALAVTRPAAIAPVRAAKVPATAPAALAKAPATAPSTLPAQASADDVKNVEKADAMARQLMARTRVGLAAVLVRSAYRDRKLEPDARPDAAAIRAEVNKLPALWLHIIDTPQRFYLVIGVPIKMPHKLGEPMLANVTLQNTSPFPITVGPEGVISPDLFFDDWIGMNGNKAFPRAAYDRIANVLVLPPDAKSTQIVRLDQGPVTAALRDRPSSDVTMYARVTTNPTARGTEIVPGPAGLRRDFQKPFDRKNSAMTDEVKKQQVLAGLEGLPSERMVVLDELQAHVMAARDPNADGRTLALAPELNDAIKKATTDPVPDVAAWAAYLTMQLAQPDDKPKLAEALASSHDWEVRLLAGVAAMDLPAKDRQKIAERLSHDTLPEITQFGAAVLQDLVHPTSQPAMAPTGSHAAPESTPATAPSAPPLPEGPALAPTTQP